MLGVGMGAGEEVLFLVEPARGVDVLFLLGVNVTFALGMEVSFVLGVGFAGVVEGGPGGDKTNSPLTTNEPLNCLLRLVRNVGPERLALRVCDTALAVVNPTISVSTITLPFLTDLIVQLDLDTPADFAVAVK